jgi:hypothetical protein
MSMIGSLAGAGGSLLGGTFNAIGGYQAAKAQRKAAARQRAAIADAIRKGKEYMEGQTREERDRALVQIRRAEREGIRAQRQAEQRADAALYNAFASPAYQAQAGYLASLFGQGIPDALAQDYAGRIRGAQTARGLHSGGAPAQEEARFLSSMAAQQRQQLLPQLRQLALDPLQLRQQEVGMNLQNRAAAQGIGLAQLTGQSQALMAAQNMAAQRFGSYNQLLGMTAQMAFSAASPRANALLATGQSLQQAGSQMQGGLGGLGG